MPAWLAAHLVATGAVTEEGVGRRARVWSCPCGARTLRGLDGDLLALDVRVDVDPITPLAEVLALATARRTYFLLRHQSSSGRTGWSLNHRDRYRIAANRDEPIFVEHRCGQFLPKAPMGPPRRAHENSDEPPF